MRVFGIMILALALSASFKPNAEEYILLSTKTFSVKGSTSIGKYDCDYSMTTKDTLFLNRKKGLTYKVPVKEFGCGNFLLNRDFRKTLREKEYPWVTIQVFDVRKSGTNYKYDLQLDLAGKRKTFQNLNLMSVKEGLKGEIELKFSDFNLDPPSKLGGAIKVKEEINLSILLKKL